MAFDDVEGALLKWFSFSRLPNVPVSGPFVGKRKSLPSWLNMFKTRNSILFLGVYGEAAAVDNEESEKDEVDYGITVGTTIQFTTDVMIAI